MSVKFDIPTITIPEIKVDTSGIKAVVQKGSAAGKNIERSTLFAQLASYKVKTVPILGNRRPLCEEDMAAVTKIVAKLNANNWLDENTRSWCDENAIPVK